jgi:SNF2 family DNA or RNA helicase
VIVSYDMLKDVSEVLGAVGFKVVILDESHCIKNPTVRGVCAGGGC